MPFVLDSSIPAPGRAQTLRPPAGKSQPATGSKAARSACSGRTTAFYGGIAFDSPCSWKPTEIPQHRPTAEKFQSGWKSRIAPN